MVALETSTRAGRLALAEDGRVVAEADFPGLAADLVAALDEATRAAGAALQSPYGRSTSWPPESINLVALSIGPGSFTGLRIAVMFARTFAWRTGAKLVAVPTLRVIAENAPHEEQTIGVITDAQRGGAYWAAYHCGADGALVCVLGESVGEAEEAAQQLPRDAYLIGDGLERYGRTFAPWRQAEHSLWLPRAAVVAALGWRKHLAGEHVAAERLEPLYVRRPAPEEVWERRQRGGR
jgi:tRNA threonylcarbamoyladenosine biosynthesis protein TsaB